MNSLQQDKEKVQQQKVAVGKDKDNSNNIQKITYSLLGNIPENLLIRPDLIRYKSFDGIRVSSPILVRT